jgi:hypothetical protein
MTQCMTQCMICVGTKMPAIFEELTAQNCAFKSNHSYNVGRIVRGRKWWEGARGRPLRAMFMACCSVKQDIQSLIWPTDTYIKPSHLYTLSYIGSFAKPGREYAPKKIGKSRRKWFCDWILQHTYTFNPPIFLPCGVGRGVHYPSDSHSKHISHAYREAYKRIQTGQGCSLVVPFK